MGRPKGGQLNHSLSSRDKILSGKNTAMKHIDNTRDASGKRITTHEAMEALDVVYNFLMQNDGSQPSLESLEKIMWFVDEKQHDHFRGQMTSIKTEPNGLQENLQNRPEPTSLEDRSRKVKQPLGRLERLLFKCGECPYAFSSKEDVDLHRDRVHNTKEKDVPNEVEVEIGNAEGDKSVLKQSASHGATDEEDTKGTDRDREEEMSVDDKNQRDKLNKRINLTIEERRDIIKQYDALPSSIAQIHKAKTLGLNRTTLRNILSKRDQILACQTTARKRARRAKKGKILDEIDTELDDHERNEEVVKHNAPPRKLRKRKDFTKQNEENSSIQGADAELDLEADVLPITCTKAATDDRKSFSCQECGLVLGSKPELADHMAYIHHVPKHNKHTESNDVTIINFAKHEKPQRSISMTIQEKQNIIKRYENLPTSMSRSQKARVIGIKRSTLVNIISNQENILAFQNPTMKRARHAKEKDVADVTVEWIHSVMARNGELSYSMIRRKASEVAGEMGKSFSPTHSWAQRLCKRGNISLNMVKTEVLATVGGDESDDSNINDEDPPLETNDGKENMKIKTEVENPINSCASPSEDIIERKFSCQDCELDFDEFDGLQHHMAISHDEIYETEEATGEIESRENADYQEKFRKRTVHTIQQKQDIIKRCENLPENMSIKRRAEILGIKRTTLLKFLANKEKIMSFQNTSRKSLRCGKDKEVEEATLIWLRSAVQSGVSCATITSKASEIAQEMGKDFRPPRQWASRFCDRHNINVGKEEQEGDVFRATDPIL